MAKIVMVHGAGNELWGPASIRSRWVPALADGLAWHGVEIDPADVGMVFYGDLFRPDPERGYDPPYDVKKELANIGELLKGLHPEVDLAQVTTLLTEQHMDRMLAQAAAYFEHREIRTAARARAEATIGDDTRVLVAHSLGTVVAYETLCANPDLGVTDFITMGSPLTGELIHARLEPTPGPDGGAWPAGLTAWTNIRDANDPACAAPLAGQFVGGVQDKAVDNGHRVHDPEPYLNNPSTGAAIAAGLARG